MAKAVFRPGEITLGGEKVILDPPHSFPDLAHMVPVEEDLEEIPEKEEYSGPTADDLRREAESFRIQWDAEREAMIRSARAEADGIVKEAEEAAFLEVKRKTDEAQSLKRQAMDESEKIIAEAREKAKEIENDSRSAFESERKDAEERGKAAGR
jgi:flagellar assembly protein FliH